MRRATHSIAWNRCTAASWKRAAVSGHRSDRITTESMKLQVFRQTECHKASCTLRGFSGKLHCGFREAGSLRIRNPSGGHQALPGHPPHAPILAGDCRPRVRDGAAPRDARPGSGMFRSPAGLGSRPDDSGPDPGRQHRPDPDGARPDPRAGTLGYGRGAGRHHHHHGRVAGRLLSRDPGGACGSRTAHRRPGAAVSRKS